MRTTASILIILVFAAFIQAQPTQFTYQGRLTDGTIPPTGTYQMQFSLFGSLADDDPIGSTITHANVSVVQGVFTVTLQIDHPDAFDGGPRWLAIAVKRLADPDYTPLNPRQPLTSAPYSVKSLSASSADGLSIACVQCVSDTQIQSIDGGKVTGTVANATTAVNVSGIVPIANGGTGSSIKNFVDLSTNQINIAGNKRFLQTTTLDFANIGSLTNNGGAVFNGSATFNGADPVQMNALSVGNGLTADVASVSELNATNGVSAGSLNVSGNVTVDTNTLFVDAVNNKVGIGEVAPSAVFHVKGVQPPTVVSGNGHSATEVLRIVGGRGGDTLGFGGIIDDAGTGGSVLIQGGDGGDTGGGFSGGGGSITLQPGLRGNFERPSGPDGNVLLAPGGGKVGIGTNSPDLLLSVNGNASKVGGGSWEVFSDARLKNIHGKFTRGLSDLLRLEPIKFEYRPDNRLGLRSEGEYIGFSAQDVQRIVPEAVSRSSNGFLQINNDPILWTMLNSIKDQQKQIEKQSGEISELKAIVCSIKPDAKVCGPK